MKNLKHQLKNLLKQYSGKADDGRTYHSHIFSNTQYKFRTKLILLEDKILYIGPLWDVTEKENGGAYAVVKDKTENRIIIRHVTEYTCQPIFSLFNRCAWITGEGTVDLRTQTAEAQTIVFPGVFFFWWFCCGPIKEACKRLS